MTYLHEALTKKVTEWRESNYSCQDFPSIREILEYATENTNDGMYRYLRSAQFKALEIYWYLRLVENTPKVPQLYERLFPMARERRTAMGLTSDEIRDYLEDESWDALYQKIRTDNAFVRRNHLESLRETLTLDYPSYILALAMGAGKTILMATIVATEFAMAQWLNFRPITI